MFRLSRGNNSKLNMIAAELRIPHRLIGEVIFPAGKTCPGASICKAWTDEVTGKITRGKDCTILCYRAKIEAYATASRRLAHENYNTMHGKTEGEMTDILLDAIPYEMKVVRVPGSGDMWCQEIYSAFCNVAKARPRTNFFGYTKTKHILDWRPPNFRLEYSWGGRWDAELQDPVSPTAFIADKDDEDALALLAGLPLVCTTKERATEDWHRIGYSSFILPLH